MKKLIAALCITSFFLGSCAKKDSGCDYSDSGIVAPASEQEALQDSLTAHGIQATKAPAGFYYTINAPGTEPRVRDLCSTIAAFYRVGYFNGNGIDSTAGTPAIFLLGRVIPGWQKGIPLVGKNGNIDLYIPPSLAYGPKDVEDNDGNVVIPGNSYLVFHVVVTDIQ